MSRSYEDPLGDDWSAPDSGSASTPATSARALADILREAGISSAGAGGRRRRRADDDSPTDQAAWTDVPAADARAAATEPVTHDTQTDFGSLSSYLLSSTHTAPGRAVPDLAAPGHAVPGIAATPDTGRRLDPPPRTDTGPVPTHGWASQFSGQPHSSGSSTSTGAAADDSATGTNSRKSASVTETGAPSNGSPSAPAHANRSPSPLAPAPAEDPDETESAVPLHSGAISWAILVVELLAALGLGVAAWYAFSALWDLLPYAAAFAGPLVVTGLVAVAGALRARTGRNPLGLPTLCILVFAGTVLVVLPAATLIVP